VELASSKTDDVAKRLVVVALTTCKSVNEPNGAESTGTKIEPERVRFDPDALMKSKWPPTVRPPVVEASASVLSPNTFNA
jgi:hypothetical protein